MDTSGIDKIIDKVIENEGGSKVTNDPKDGGGRTQFGISEKSNPEAWKDGVVTAEEAREIYKSKYVHGPRFDLISDPSLQFQLVDFGVNSGPPIAIMKLQLILGLEQDGILGPKTLTELSKYDAKVINNLLMGERIKMISKIVSKNPSQLKFLNGWISRALEFLV